VPVVWVIRLAALIALAVSGYLAFISLQSGGPAIGCGGLPHFDCQHVLASRWSSWMGMPVSLPAVGVYALLLAVTFAIRRQSPPWLVWAAGLTLPLLAAMAGGAAVWFLVLLAVAVRQVCVYCLAVHACGLTIAALVLPRVSPRRGQIGAVVLAAAGLTVLAAGQVLRPPPTYRLEEFEPAAVATPDADAQAGGDKTPKIAKPAPGPKPALGPPAAPEDPVPEPPQDRRQYRDSTLDRPGARPVVIFKGRVTLDVRNHPLLGKPDARYVLVEMSDYTCSHCRQLHHLLKESRARYQGELAVLVLPVPTNTKCNQYAGTTHEDQKEACEYARLGLALWLAAPQRYETFHDWLFEPKRPPALEKAQRYAQELAGAEALAAQQKSEAVQTRLHRYVELYRQSGAGSVPKMFSGDYKIEGVPDSADKLSDALRRVLGAAPSKP
jgi:protein-disulfide isomerase/uncharacterized membrane protein